MIQNWQDFLASTNTPFISGQSFPCPLVKEHYHNKIYAVADLAVLTVSGKDAEQFLQGQMTCSIQDVSETQSSFGAFCTAKGRVISTFLMGKRKEIFLLVVPAELLPVVKKKLQFYVLRSDVQLIDSSDSFCLFGYCRTDTVSGKTPVPERPLAASPVDDGTVISLPTFTAAPRCLGILPANSAIGIWQDCTAQGLQTGIPDEWRTLDILSGIPWLNLMTTEQFIPQMLNLDQLGGISLNKGCYTGQEIVARTHYLGKAKRKMYLAECRATEPPEAGSAIKAAEDASDKSVGSILSLQTTTTGFVMLVILQTDYALSEQLVLANQNRDRITVMELVYSI